jgi:hypothetical protein
MPTGADAEPTSTVVERRSAGFAGGSWETTRSVFVFLDEA